MASRKTIPKKIRQQVYDKYNGRCAYCGKKIEYKDMQVDHIVPLEWYNGINDISNLNPACRMCNFYKSNFPLEDFRDRMRTLRDRLNDLFIYRLSKNYGLITEDDNDITFYFERADSESGVDEIDKKPPEIRFDYLGYHSNVCYDEEFDYYYGRINGIRDFVNYEAHSLGQAEIEFCNAVDDYLNFCEELGKEPDKGGSDNENHF